MLPVLDCHWLLPLLFGGCVLLNKLCMVTIGAIRSQYAAYSEVTTLFIMTDPLDNSNGIFVSKCIANVTVKLFYQGVPVTR